MSKRFPVSIPEPGTTPAGVSATIRAMKMMLELMVGDRDENSLGVPRLFVQRTSPVGGQLGDLWINTDTHQMAYYTPTGIWELLQ